MKKRHALFFVVIILVASACKPSTPVATGQSATATTIFDRDLDDRSLFHSGLITSERSSLDSLQDRSAYRIDLRINQDMLSVDGWQEVQYTNREDVPLEAIYFRLYPNISGGSVSVSGLEVAGTELDPIYEQERSALRVPLQTPLQPGEEIRIEMNFSIELPTEMSGNYGLFGSFDGILALQELYPVIPVYDDDGWSVEIPPPHGDLTHLDASFYLVRVTAPATLTLVASGVEVERSEQDDNQVVIFAAGPARDFYLVAGDNFEVVSTSLGETAIHSYAPAEYHASSTLALDAVREALRSFSERLGTYPYTEFDIVCTPMQALGMEYPGATAISAAMYDETAEISGLPSQVFLESTLAHEVGHQWFYNIIGNDQVDEPWMDEAPTQYVTWVYYVDRYGKQNAEGFRDSWLGRWDRVDRDEIPIGLPSGDYDSRAYGAIVYGRGPLFIEALAQEMGQETFDTFMRAYYENYKWEIGTATGFRQLAEETCQCDLSALFDAWVYAP